MAIKLRSTDVLFFSLAFQPYSFELQMWTFLEISTLFPFDFGSLLRNHNSLDWRREDVVDVTSSREKESKLKRNQFLKVKLSNWLWRQYWCTSSHLNVIVLSSGSQPGVREKYQGVHQIFIILRMTHKMPSRKPLALIRDLQVLFFLLGGTRVEKGWEPLA